MATPTDLSIWLREQAWPLGILAAILLTTYLSLKFSALRRRRALNRERAGVTETSFAEYLAQFGVDAVLAGSVYRYLQEVQMVKFPILPSDALDDDLGMDSDDIRQTIGDLMAALGRDTNPALAHTPILTVIDLVRFLQASPALMRYNVA
jgi:hypothetical protein